MPITPIISNPDVIQILRGASIKLLAHESFSTMGEIESYRWSIPYASRLVGGPDEDDIRILKYRILNPNTKEPELKIECSGEYTICLAVRDSKHHEAATLKKLYVSILEYPVHGIDGKIYHSYQEVLADKPSNS